MTACSTAGQNSLARLLRGCVAYRRRYINTIG